MTSHVPWHTFSLDHPGAVPDTLDPAGVIALIPGIDREWAARVALDLARSLARSGRPVCLCDFDLESPQLHRLAEVAPGAGVTDLAAYGASVDHVATELEENLRFVSAGTPVANFAAVLTSPTLEALLSVGAESKAAVLVLVPGELEGAEAILRQADRAVALGPRGAFATSAEVPLVLGLEPELEAESASDPEPEPDESLLEPASAQDPDPTGGEVWSFRDAAALEDFEDAVDAPAEEPTDVTAAESVARRPAPAVSTRVASPPRPGRRSRGRRAGLWWSLLLLALVAVVVAWWIGLIELPGVASRRADVPPAVSSSPGQASVPSGSEEEDPAADEAGAREVDVASADVPEPGAAAPTEAPPIVPSVVVAPHLRWSVRLAAFRERNAALAATRTLSERAPGALLTVVPVDVNGTRWYRILAPLAESGPDAETLRSRLASELQAADADQWLVRTAPWAFLVFEESTLEAARDGVVSLESRGIDAYVLRAGRATGGPVFRVYAGAFRNAEEAGALGELLAEAGLGDRPLVERRGERPE